MKFIAGFIGAIAGAIFGLALAIMLVNETSDGNDFATELALLGLAPIGMILGAIAGIISAIYALRYWQLPDPQQILRRKKRLLTMAILLGFPAIVTGMLWLAQRATRPPSDDKLLENFSRHQSEFEQLARMVQTDKKLTRVDQNWTAPDNPQTIGVSTARIGAYRHLLAKAGTPRGFQTMGSTGDNIQFYYWLTGSAISSDTDKGYAYLTTPPAQERKSLDNCQPDEKNGTLAYRHIQGHWYLFYEYLPG